MEKLRLLVVDKDLTTCEIEVDFYQFKHIGIDIKNAKKHEKKRDLNVEITNFLESFKEVK